LTLTNPGGLGTVASVPRLTAGGAIVATGAIGYPPGFGNADPQALRALGVSKVMQVTSTYDHRVVQGAQSGEYLRRVDELLQGRSEFLRADLRIARPRGRAVAAIRRRCDRTGDAAIRGGVRRAGRRDLARGRRGHGAGVGVSDARTPGGESRPAGVARAQRFQTRSGDVRPDARPAKRDPGVGARRQSRREDACRRVAEIARHLQYDDRLRSRAHLEHRAAPLAARVHRDGKHNVSLSRERQSTSCSA